MGYFRCGGGNTEVTVKEHKVFKWQLGDYTIQNDGLLVSGATYNNNGYSGSWTVTVKVNNVIVQTISDYNGSGTEGYAFDPIEVKTGDVISITPSVSIFNIAINGYMAVVG